MLERKNRTKETEMQFHADTTCAHRTGFVTAELYYWHDTLNWCGFLEPGLEMQPGLHFEHPETKRRLQNLVEATELAPKLASHRPRPAAMRSSASFIRRAISTISPRSVPRAAATRAS